MTLYIVRQWKTIVSTNQSGTMPVITRGSDQADERFSAVTAIAEASAAQVVVPNTASDLELPLGSGIVTGRMLLIESDVDITIKLGGTEAERALALKVPVASSSKARLSADVQFTALYVTVPGAVDANVYYAVVGA